MTDNVGAIQPTSYFKYQGPSYNMPLCGAFDGYSEYGGAFPSLGGRFNMGNLGGLTSDMFQYSGGIMPFNFSTLTTPDNNSYFDNMKQYQQFYNDYYIDQQKMQRNQQLQVNAPMNSIQQAARNLKDKIRQNEQDQVPQAFKAYVATVASAYGGDANDQNVINQALSMYAQMNEGVTLEEDLRKVGNGSFTQGLISGLTLGLYGNKSAEDNIAEITGQPVGKDESIKKGIGTFLGAGTLFGGIGLLIRALIVKK